MLDRSDAQLIGYLFNALESEEREQVENELQKNPELRRKLRRLKRFLAVLDQARPEFTPPPGLVQRTCARVARERARRAAAFANFPATPQTTVWQSGGAFTGIRGGRGFRWAPLSDYWAGERASWSALDLVAASLVILLLVAILLPALVETRFHYQVAACRENFHRMYLGLSQYHSLHPGYPLHASTGAEVARAVGFFTGDGSEAWRSCGCPGWSANVAPAPGAESLSNEVAAGSWSCSGYTRTLLSLAPVGNADGVPMSSASLVIWRDARSWDPCGPRCWSHFGRGENWLFADGHVQFMPQPAVLAWEERSVNLLALSQGLQK